MNRNLTAPIAGGIAVVAISAALAAPPLPKPNQKADPQMKAVLNQLVALKPKPIEKLSPTEARKQPLPGDAVKALVTKRNGGVPPKPIPVGRVEDRTIPGPAGQLPVRVYTPTGEGPFPVIVYAHGGGWVIASIQAYDASCRALAADTKAVVVSVGYRQAPEHKFPAAHEDFYAATQYVMENAAQFGGDPARVAVAGESAGGNLAAAACLMARDRGGKMPVYQALVYPIADTNLDTPSYRENANAKPLNRPMMAWFFQHTLARPEDRNSPYLAILRNPNLRGVPDATVITAEIDPLRSEGKAFADKLKGAGADVRYRNYAGVTHEFFGMRPAVAKAKEAEMYVAQGLRGAFERTPASPAPQAAAAIAR